MIFDLANTEQLSSTRCKLLVERPDMPTLQHSKWLPQGVEVILSLYLPSFPLLSLGRVGSNPEKIWFRSENKYGVDGKLNPVEVA